MGVKNSDRAVPGAKSSLWKQELEVHVDGTQAGLQARGPTSLVSFYLLHCLETKITLQCPL